MRKTTIKIEMYDEKFDVRQHFEILLENYIDLRDKHDVDPIDMMVGEMAEEMNEFIKLTIKNKGKFKGEW